MCIKVIVDGVSKVIEEKVCFGKLLPINYKERLIPIVLAKQNDKYYELTSKIKEEGEIKFIDITEKVGMDAYKRTAQFIFIKAAIDIFKDAKITIEHSINKGIYGEIHKESPLTKEELAQIKNRMDEIISSDIKIEKRAVDKNIAQQVFETYKMDDKLRLLRYVKSDRVKLYKIDNRYDYFYGSMAYSTGVLKNYDLLFYNPGFIIRLPRTKNPTELPVFKEQKKLYGVFKETAKWLDILGVADVGALNYTLTDKSIDEIIRVSEALHEKKIACIADKFSEKKDAKIILVAGPSSSGKTTFTKRLSVQLKVNGLKPVMISLDDYFVSRDKTPVDEEGKPDFECLEALDLKLFNKHLNELLLGKEIEVPCFNFKTGVREWCGNKVSLDGDRVLIVEGIHGLNDRLTSEIDDKYKFKVYISALTQLNLDSHNKISTTDVRKVRRIVRDSLSRGYDAQKTLSMWPSIKRGEEKNIFIFQEEADVMFNSTLVYELSVLKALALKELSRVSEDSEVYYEAKRLKTFLNFFEDIDFDRVPSNSLLREFIGGSCFYKY
ncbi:nucleoside kinase [uncultured Clostridium sp.]|jgi:uridine kinase|uniref:nucleoside kinase n=1 Tax=uncultured Clostridium sp. TaxID=59620 RepID=UPI0026178FE0|nr:nucleoside kinase [uncultured Clostridium sp.]